MLPILINRVNMDSDFKILLVFIQVEINAYTFTNITTTSPIMK